MIVKDKILSQTTCFHCGEDLNGTSFHIAEKQFCCKGCQTVFEIINKNDLCSYYDLKRIDLASKFYIQAKLFLKKAEENSITLISVRGCLIDVIDYYSIEENKDFIIDLREKSNFDLFNYFKEGADEGNKYSMKMLSDCYKEGKGCVSDYDTAKYWELKAKE